MKFIVVLQPKGWIAKREDRSPNQREQLAAPVID